MSKHEEWLVSYHSKPYETLAHFNPNHDPKNGQFAKSSSNSLSGIRAKRAQKKTEKQKLNDARNDAIRFSNEYENSKEGRRLRDIHDKTYEAYFDNDNEEIERTLEKQFMDAEHEYLSAMGRYEASRIIEKYGPEITAKIGWVDDYKDESDLIKKYGERYYYIHQI